MYDLRDQADGNLAATQRVHDQTVTEMRLALDAQVGRAEALGESLAKCEAVLVQTRMGLQVHA